MRHIGIFFAALLAISVSAARAETATSAACISLEQTRPDQTPDDLDKLASICVEAGDFHRAAMLDLLSNLRGHFDAARFKDKHAYRIAYELRAKSFDGLPKDVHGRYVEAEQDFMVDGLLRTAFCMQLRSLQQPDYVPVYMARQFPNAAVSNTVDFLKPDFDAEKAWEAEIERTDCALD